MIRRPIIPIVLLASFSLDAGAGLNLRAVQTPSLSEKTSFSKNLPAAHQIIADSSVANRLARVQAIAATSRATVQRVTLSQLVGNYHAETERNLQATFASAKQSGAILFFDEADALLGKRGAVQESHDRYTNSETSYLLQQIKQYDGPVVLGTDTSATLDSAVVACWQVIPPVLRPTSKP